MSTALLNQLWLNWRISWDDQREENIIPVLVNVNYEQTIVSAIEEARFDWKYVGLTPEEIKPINNNGQRNSKIYAVPFSRSMRTMDLPKALKLRGQKLGFKDGFKFADPLAVLRLACTNPDRQRKYPLVTFFQKDGRWWHVGLSGNNRTRNLRVSRISLKSLWDRHVRFLAVGGE